MRSGFWLSTLGMVAGLGGIACQGLYRIGVPVEVPAEHLTLQVPPRARSRAEDLEFLNACWRQRRANDIDFTESGITGRASSIWGNRIDRSSFTMPWDSVIQLVPQAACTVRGNCESPAFWEVGRLFKLTAWKRVLVRDPATHDEWRLVTVAMLAEGCAPADVLMALGHFVGPDRIVGCGQTCRAALAVQNP